MQSYYWIKLYHEILHDPKMGRLSDRLWRRAIEVFLLAGENGGDGKLPVLEDMAWTLRAEPTELSADLEQLEKLGILEMRDELWFVTHFAERQAAADGAERVSRHRNRAKKRRYYGTETDREPNGNESVTDEQPEGNGPETDGQAECNGSVTGCYNGCNESVTTRYTELDIDIDKRREENAGVSPRYSPVTQI